MEISAAELFLAYRQAKISLHQEQQGAWKLSWAQAERNLPQILGRLRRHLATEPGWFSDLNMRSGMACCPRRRFHVQQEAA